MWLDVKRQFPTPLRESEECRFAPNLSWDRSLTPHRGRKLHGIPIQGKREMTGLGKKRKRYSSRFQTVLEVLEYERDAAKITRVSCVRMPKFTNRAGIYSVSFSPRTRICSSICESASVS
jgi:hypothetical protein